MFKTVLTKLLCLSLLNFVSCQVATNFTEGTNVPDVCLCATSGQCDRAGGGGESDGSGIINPRVLNTGGVNINVGTNVSLCQPATTGITLNAKDQSSCGDGLDKCCPDVGYTCGVSYTPISGAPEAAPGQTPYGAYPHQVAIYSADNKFLGGGALIDQFNVLTAAHIVVNASKPLLIKIGHWDLKASQEPLPRITVGSSIIAVHPNFTASNLKNNIAIIRLPVPVPLGRFPTIGSICLPSAPVSGIRCMLSGWGNQNATNPTNILRHVDLPILNSSTCQNMLRTTRLGPNFVFDSKSFICAGGEKGKDACAGDGGSPLSCYIVDRYYLVGVVSWGIGCGTHGVPGVYTNIFNYIPWIQKTTAQLQNEGQPSTPPSLPPRPTTTSGTIVRSSTTTTIDGKVTKSADPTVTSTEKTVSTTISVVSSTLSTIMSTIASTLASTIRSTPPTTSGSSTTRTSGQTVNATSPTPSTTASPKVTTMSIISGSTAQTLTSTRSSSNNGTSSGSTTSATKGTNSGTQSTTSGAPKSNATSSAASTTRSNGAVNSTSSTPKSNVTVTTTTARTSSSSSNSTATKAQSSTLSSSVTGSTISRNANSTTSTTLKPNSSTTSKAGNSSTSATKNGTVSTTITTSMPSNGTRPGNGTTVKSGTATTKPATIPTRPPSSTASGGTKTTPKGTTTTMRKGNSTMTTKPANVTVKGTPKTTTKNSNFLGMN